jgi:hypothetical protein
MKRKARATQQKPRRVQRTAPAAKPTPLVEAIRTAGNKVQPVFLPTTDPTFLKCSAAFHHLATSYRADDRRILALPSSALPPLP